MAGTTEPDRQSLLANVADNWEPREIRNLAATLLRLADSIDQDWNPAEVKSVFRWPSPLSRIERNAANLAAKADAIYHRRAMRREFIPGHLLAEPAWDMLLDLFMQFAGGARVSTTSLCIASGVPSTTALRYIDALESAKLVTRSMSEFDKRVTFLSLTDEGVLAMGRYLEKA